MRFTKYFLALLFGLTMTCSTISVAAPTASSSNWSYVGSPGFLSNKGVGADRFNSYGMAVATDGTPYVAGLFTLDEYGKNIQLVTMKFNSQSNQWQSLGNIQTYSIKNVALAISPTGVPYLAHMGPAKQIVVLKYDSQSQKWVPLGNVASAPVTYDFGLKFAFDQTGIPYLAYVDRNNGTIKVMKYTSTGWISLQNIISQPGDLIGNPEIAITQSNQVYVAFMSVNVQNYTLRVVTLTDKGWEPVAPNSLPVMPTQGGVVSTTFTTISLTLDNNGIPYVAYNDPSWARVSVINLLNGNWSQVGQERFTPYWTDTMSMVIDHNNTPYLSFTVINTQNITEGVMKFDGKVWVNYLPLPPIASTDNILQQSLHVTPSNKLYTGFIRCINHAYDQCSMSVMDS